MSVFGVFCRSTIYPEIRRRNKFTPFSLSFLSQVLSRSSVVFSLCHTIYWNSATLFINTHKPTHTLTKAELGWDYKSEDGLHGNLLLFHTLHTLYVCHVTRLWLPLLTFKLHVSHIQSAASHTPFPFQWDTFQNSLFPWIEDSRENYNRKNYSYRIKPHPVQGP